MLAMGTRFWRINEERKDEVKGKRYIIVGGAGFIGSHFCDRLMSQPETERVSVYDNFSSGRDWHLAHHLDDSRFKIYRGQVAELDHLTEAMRDHDTVIHLASNPDIAAAVTDPDIDFREGTHLTRCVVEAMRKADVKQILYASGSGVYGDLGEFEPTEDFGPSIPISTYGASKQAGESLISSYCFMFDWTGCVFRFGNVVGPRQTHGVGFDFVRRLIKDPSTLRILGDGSQSKSYIYVSDVVEAVLAAHEKKSRRIFCLQCCDRRLYHRKGDSRSCSGVCCQFHSQNPISVYGWQPRLEGRRSHRSIEHG